MSIPSRNAEIGEILSSSRTFFVTTKTSMGRALLQSQRGAVWQRGFSEVRVEDRQSFLKHRQYIAQNPVRAGLCETPEMYPYCYAYLASKKRAGAKARRNLGACGTAEAVP